MKETEKALVTVSVEEVLPEQLEGINVIAKVDGDSSGIGFLAKADSALQATSSVLEMIPQKGLFKVEVPEGFTLQDLVQVKGEKGHFQRYGKGLKWQDGRPGKAYSSWRDQPHTNSRRWSCRRCHGGWPGVYDRDQR